jgi:putative transposase
MYYWRKLTADQRKDALEYRRLQRYPKHSPPHFDASTECQFILTATCYEHKKVIGKSLERMAECEKRILEICHTHEAEIYAWCVLPKHYHLLLKTDHIKEIRISLGKFHGRSSYQWNLEDNERGRKVWHNCFERKMRSERHYFASLNYVLNNAVHHRYVDRWEDWIWSNANEYLETMGRERALEIWKEFPVLDYGSKWDVL